MLALNDNIILRIYTNNVYIDHRQAAYHIIYHIEHAPYQQNHNVNVQPQFAFVQLYHGTVAGVVTVVDDIDGNIKYCTATNRTIPKNICTIIDIHISTVVIAVTIITVVTNIYIRLTQQTARSTHNICARFVHPNACLPKRNTYK
jgi:hypothetical protein